MISVLSESKVLQLLVNDMSRKGPIIGYVYQLLDVSCNN